MLIEHEGARPQIAASAYVAPTAVVCGDVSIGDDARILFGAVLTADGGPVTIGARKVRTPQGRTLGKSQAAKVDGKWHRKETATSERDLSGDAGR